MLEFIFLGGGYWRDWSKFDSVDVTIIVQCDKQKITGINAQCIEALLGPIVLRGVTEGHCANEKLLDKRGTDWDWGSSASSY